MDNTSKAIRRSVLFDGHRPPPGPGGERSKRRVFAPSPAKPSAADPLRDHPGRSPRGPALPICGRTRLAGLVRDPRPFVGPHPGRTRRVNAPKSRRSLASPALIWCDLSGLRTRPLSRGASSRVGQRTRTRRTACGRELSRRWILLRFASARQSSLRRGAASLYGRRSLNRALLSAVEGSPGRLGSRQPSSLSYLVRLPPEAGNQNRLSLPLAGG